MAAGFLHNLRSDRMFMTLPTAVQAYLRWYAERHDDVPPGFVQQPPPEPLVGEPERPGGLVQRVPPREPGP